ncbi:phosphatidylglycerophosphatase A family protein [Anianabacter salinae]|uniref:phosphatidylglycerophosphatase A family protein n=1 Tax=Anianabacter salinae TaxID=2851023 RepID=UPI00225E3A02|nr:phosphatidylglycerophosphatase A [Anianabacter salinae]MBV0912117.1 phosphatidylglycerophosphatase A [Anianabacter salinae]
MTGLIATVFGVGRIGFAPGTFGSAVAVLLAWGLHGLGGFPLLLAATVVVIPLGWWAVREETRGAENDDPSEIVIDEVAGQWIALFPLSAGLWFAGAPAWLFPYPGWIGAFLLFRLFDIWKPGPVGWADRKGGPWGVMVDDLIAGAMAAVVVALAAAIAHAGMGA